MDNPQNSLDEIEEVYELYDSEFMAAARSVCRAFAEFADHLANVAIAIGIVMRDVVNDEGVKRTLRKKVRKERYLRKFRQRGEKMKGRPRRCQNARSEHLLG